MMTIYHIKKIDFEMIDQNLKLFSFGKLNVLRTSRVYVLARIFSVVFIMIIIRFMSLTEAARLSNGKFERWARCINSGDKISEERLIFPDIWYLSAHVLFCFIGRGTTKVEGNLYLCTESR